MRPCSSMTSARVPPVPTSIPSRCAMSLEAAKIRRGLLRLLLCVFVVLRGGGDLAVRLGSLRLVLDLLVVQLCGLPPRVVARRWEACAKLRQGVRGEVVPLLVLVEGRELPVADLAGGSRRIALDELTVRHQ